MPSKKPHIILDVCEASDKNFFSKFPIAYQDLIKGKIKAVRGGKKYKEEVSKCSNLVKLFNQLKAAGFVIDIVDSTVDETERLLNNQIHNSSQKCKNACDDAHLFSLAKHGVAKYAISNDSRLACCRRELNKSGIPQRMFTQLSIIKTDVVYQRLKRLNRL